MTGITYSSSDESSVDFDFLRLERVRRACFLPFLDDFFLPLSESLSRSTGLTSPSLEEPSDINESSESVSPSSSMKESSLSLKGACNI